MKSIFSEGNLRSTSELRLATKNCGRRSSCTMKPDDPEYIKVIEAQGGLVVTASLCFGTRNMWVEVNESLKDPAEALARWYVAERPSCPRFYGEHDNRTKYVIDMCREFKWDGSFGARLMFWDSWLV